MSAVSAATQAQLRSSTSVEPDSDDLCESATHARPITTTPSPSTSTTIWMEAVQGEEERSPPSGSVGTSWIHEVAGGDPSAATCEGDVPTGSRPVMTRRAHGTSSDRRESFGTLREPSGDVEGTAPRDEVSPESLRVRVRQEHVHLRRNPVQRGKATILARRRREGIRIGSSDVSSCSHSVHGDPKAAASRAETTASRLETTAGHSVGTAGCQVTIEKYSVTIARCPVAIAS